MEAGGEAKWYVIDDNTWSWERDVFTESTRDDSPYEGDMDCGD